MVNLLDEVFGDGAGNNSTEKSPNAGEGDENGNINISQS